MLPLSIVVSGSGDIAFISEYIEVPQSLWKPQHRLLVVFTDVHGHEHTLNFGFDAVSDSKPG